MVNIEPYDFQKKTNIKEHNDIVAKINEIVDVINNTNLDTILPKISKLETDVNTIEATDSLQWTDIENLKTKNTEYDTHFGLNDTQIADINKSLISDVALMNGTTTGNVKVRIGRNDAPSIDSDDYNIQKPTSVELVQGSAPAMVKAQITLSDGTVLISDDFMFTTEAIGQDVYISSFVFKNGNVAGTISADIGLSNGTTLEANNFVVPTDPNVTTAISDLQTRMTAVEGGSVGGLDELKAQVQTNTSNIGTLTTEIDNLDIQKADQSNSNQEIVAGTITANNITKGGINVATVNDIPDISGKVNIAQGSANAGKVLGIGSDGNVTPTIISSGEVWEEVDLGNFPTNWVAGDRIKVLFYVIDTSNSNPNGWTSGPSPSVFSAKSFIVSRSPIEVEIVDEDTSTVKVNKLLSFTPFSNYVLYTMLASMCGTSRLNDVNFGQICICYDSIFNGGGNVYKNRTITRSNITSNIAKMWRLKK